MSQKQTITTNFYYGCQLVETLQLHFIARHIILSATPPPPKKNKVEVILGCSTARLQMFLYLEMSSNAIPLPGK